MKLNKRITVGLAFVFVFALFSFSVFAVKEEKNVMDKNVTGIVNAQLSEMERSAFQTSGLPGMTIDKSTDFEFPILKVYNELFNSTVGKKLEERLIDSNAQCSEETFTDYIIMGDTPYMARIMHHSPGEVTALTFDKRYNNSEIPTYVQDLSNPLKDIVTNQDCQLEGIYCFDANSSHQGTAVYIKTNQGVYVKFYENTTSSAKVFSEEEFRNMADAYYEYLTSYEHNNNEKGEALGGNNISFLSFIQVPDNSVKSDSRIQKACIISGTIGFTLFLIGGIIIFRKRKKAH